MRVSEHVCCSHFDVSLDTQTEELTQDISFSCKLISENRERRYRSPDRDVLLSATSGDNGKIGTVACAHGSRALLECAADLASTSRAARIGCRAARRSRRSHPLPRTCVGAGLPE